MNQRILFLLDFAAFFVILFITVALRRWEISWPVYVSNCKLFFIQVLKIPAKENKKV